MRDSFIIGFIEGVVKTSIIIVSVYLALLIYFDHHDVKAPASPTVVEVRELRCQEDEDIVTTLAANGLPVAYCQQVEER